MARILIMDDDPAFRDGLRETLEDLGHAVLQAGSAREGLALMRCTPPDAVFLDYRMPDADGLSVLRTLREQGPSPAPPVVMLTAFATSSNTIEAMKLGAFDHLTKPIGRAAVAAVVTRLLRRAAPGRAGAERPVLEDPFVGNSPAMREVQKLIGLAAASEATVLILGETGTGKELVARALHANSAHAGQPFVAVNCAAIPADLLESELFGHVRGAFSGAIGDRIGAFRRADHGTLLLDEVGDMSLAMQAKILRFLQEREITPVGSDHAEPVDVRVLAATHCDLPEEVRAGRFREDLYYRLNVLLICLPPLRERPADIVPLAEHFLARAPGLGKTLSPAAARRLLTHPWTGNVRELRNLMERLGVIARGAVLEAEDVEALLASSAPPRHDSEAAPWLEGDLQTAVDRLERTMIRKALAEAGGNRAEAARRLGIHRQLLYSKMKQHGID